MEVTGCAQCRVSGIILGFWCAGGAQRSSGSGGGEGAFCWAAFCCESEMLRSHPGEVLRRQLHIGDRSMEEKLAGGG